jgi:hypothetical protein
MKLLAPAIILIIAVSDAAVFRPSGALHLSAGTFTIRLSINLLSYDRHCKRLSEAVARVKPSKRDLLGIHQQLSSISSEACGRLSSWPGLLEEGRQKRFLGALAGAVFGFVADELWHSAPDKSGHLTEKLNTIKSNLAKITNQVELLAKKQHQARQELHHLEILLELAAAVLSNARILDTLDKSLVTLAAQRRITTELLPVSAATSLWQAVKRELHSQALPATPLPSRVLYECPVAFKFDSDVLHLLIQVPIITSSYRLWYKTDHPTVIPHLSQPVRLDSGYVAVAPDGRSFVLPGKSLSSCSSIEGEPVCEGEALQSDWGNHCLSALFRGEWARALQICDMHPFKGKWAAERVSHDAFEVIVTEPTTFKEVCATRNGVSQHQGRWLAGRHNVTLAKGCRTETAAFTLHAAREGGVVTAFRPAHQWISTAEVFQALGRRSEEEAAEAESVEAGINVIREELARPDPVVPAMAGGAVGAATVAAGIGVLVGILVYRRCSRSAPPQPPAES